MGCVNTNPTGSKARPPAGQVNASTIKPQSLPPSQVQTQPISTYQPINPPAPPLRETTNYLGQTSQSGIINIPLAVSGNSVFQQNSQEYKDPNPIRSNEILDSRLSAQLNQSGNKVSQEVNLFNNEIRDSVQNRIGSSAIKISESDGYKSGVQGLKKTELLLSNSRPISESKISNKNEILGSIGNLVPPAQPIYSKPNFDWAKDIAEENFDNRFEVIPIPSIDLKIS